MSGEYQFQYRYKVNQIHARGIHFKIGGQYSFGDSLLPSFQRSSGGLYSIRGYDDQSISGDRVIETNLEYKWSIFTNDWIIAFYDRAQIKRSDINIKALVKQIDLTRAFVLPSEKVTIASFGLALDYQFHNGNQFYLVWAQALHDDGIGTIAGDQRLHAFLRLYF